MSSQAYTVRACSYFHPQSSEERLSAARLLLELINELPTINPQAETASISTHQAAAEFIGAYLERTRNSRTIFLAYSPDNKPCGIIFWQNAGTHFLISNLFVEPRHRQQGVGALLVEATLKEIQMRYPRSRSHVVADALWTSYPLFKKNGFTGPQPIPPHSYESSLKFEYPHLRPAILPVREDTKHDPPKTEPTIS